MSKNMTRKGLAIGAGLALIASGFVATAPAYAAAELNLTPSVGTKYGAFEGDTFTLVVSGNNEFLAANGSQIRFRVENAQANSSFSAFTINDVVLDDNYTDDATEYIDPSTNDTGNSIKYTGLSTGTVAKLANGDNGTSAVLGLGSAQDTLGASSTSLMTVPASLSFTNAAVADETPESLLVTAWADANNNGVIDSGEIASPTRTVTFYNRADSRVKPVLTGQPYAGDTSFKVTMTLGVINEAQTPLAALGIRVLNAAPATPDAGVSSGVYERDTTPALALNTAKTAFEVTVSYEPTTDGTAVELATTGNSATFTAEPLVDTVGGTAPTTTDNVFPAASKVTLTTAARALNATNTTADVVTSANAKINSAGSSGYARTNSSFGVALTANDGSSPAKVLAGIATTATVSTSARLSSSVYLTINGTAYTSASALAAATFSGTTDVAGKSTVTVVPTGLEEDDTITVAFVAQGSTDSVTVTLQDAVYSMNFVDGNEAVNANVPNGYDPTIVPGGSHTAKIAVADQFGLAPANGSYTVSVARAALSGVPARTTSAVWALLAPVVDGVATVSIKDNGTGVGADEITMTLIGADASANAAKFDLYYGTTSAAAGLTITDNWTSGTDSTVRLNATAVRSWHPYLTAGAAAPTVTNNFKASALTGDSDTTLIVSGTVTNASNLGVEGVPVTVSAKGLTFSFTDGDSKVIYSRDSITVPSAAGGAYSVRVYSDATGGSVTITATVGTLSKTTSVTFAAGAASTFEISAPANTAAGKTADVIVSAKDANGNPVEGATVTLSSTGPGYLINTTGTTLADGTFSTKLLLGVNDTGTAVVKVTMTLAGVSTTKTTSIVVGSGAASGSGKVNVGSFNGKLVVYAAGLNGARISWKVGGNWGSAVASSNYAIFNRPTPRAGVTVSVDIYVNGVKTLTKSVVTR